MMRNVPNWIEEGKESISTHRDLSSDELRVIMKASTAEMREHGFFDGLFMAITASFYFGYMVGKKEEIKDR